MAYHGTITLQEIAELCRVDPDGLTLALSKQHLMSPPQVPSMPGCWYEIDIYTWLSWHAERRELIQHGYNPEHELSPPFYIAADEAAESKHKEKV